MKKVLVSLLTVIIVLSMTACGSKTETEPADNGKSNTEAATAKDNAFPWEKSGKDPSAYTYEEYAALTDEQRSAFIETFKSHEVFEEWLNKAQQGQDDTMPWDADGAKQPENYSWEEYEKLSLSQKEKFTAHFASTEAFEAWMTENKPTDEELYPWEQTGAKQVQDYTYDEYNALTQKQKEAFVLAFGSAESFEAWLDLAKTAEGRTLPWETAGAKQPPDYTYEEYDKLTLSQKEAFVDYFPKVADFEKWLDSVVPDDVVIYPWEMPKAKQPENYSLKEYETLSIDEREAFIATFDSVEDFETWYDKAK